MAEFRVFHLREPRRPKLVFYVPGVIDDYPIVMYSGFGRSPETYRRMGELAAESGKLAVISDWDDGRHFTEETMIESVYYPVDTLRNMIKNPKHKFKGVFGVGHSYGGERLLKATVLDKEDRFSAVAVVQPPERLGKYLSEHPHLYKLSKIPYAGTLMIPLMLIHKPELHVWTPADQRNLLALIDNDMSLFDAIDSATSCQTPTQILYAPDDDHVNYVDALTAIDHMRQKGAEPESMELGEFDKQPTDKQMETVFGYMAEFFGRVSRREEQAA